MSYAPTIVLPTFTKLGPVERGEALTPVPTLAVQTVLPSFSSIFGAVYFPPRRAVTARDIVPASRGLGFAAIAQAPRLELAHTLNVPLPASLPSQRRESLPVGRYNNFLADIAIPEPIVPILNVSDRSVVSMRRWRTEADLAPLGESAASRSTTSSPTASSSPARSTSCNANFVTVFTQEKMERPANRTDAVFPCPVCRKDIESKQRFLNHLRSHRKYHGTQIFKCPYCPEVLIAEGDAMAKHLNTHTLGRSYKCSECSRGFDDHSTLTKHMRIHSGEKPYSCPICAASFRQSGTLNRHLKTMHAISRQNSSTETT